MCLHCAFIRILNPKLVLLPPCGDPRLKVYSCCLQKSLVPQATIRANARQDVPPSPTPSHPSGINRNDQASSYYFKLSSIRKKYLCCCVCACFSMSVRRILFRSVGILSRVTTVLAFGFRTNYSIFNFQRFSGNPLPSRCAQQILAMSIRFSDALGSSIIPIDPSPS